MTDAAHLILTNLASYSGNFSIEERVVSAHVTTDFDHYKNDPSVDLEPDLFLSQSS